jgi:hypothetical protein
MLIAKAVDSELRRARIICDCMEPLRGGLRRDECGQIPMNQAGNPASDLIAS